MRAPGAAPRAVLTRARYRYFTLPRPLPETLTGAGLTAFRDAADAAGLTAALADTPAVTIFAPQNAAFAGAAKIDVREYTISGKLELSPDLFSFTPFTSDAGTEIRITFQNGALYFNGVKIIRTDIITKNGVVHVLESAVGVRASP